MGDGFSDQSTQACLSPMQTRRLPGHSDEPGAKSGGCHSFLLPFPETGHKRLNVPENKN